MKKIWLFYFTKILQEKEELACSLLHTHKRYKFVSCVMTCTVNKLTACEIWGFHCSDNSDSSFGLKHHVDWLVEASVLEKCATSIFRAEVISWTNQPTNKLTDRLTDQLPPSKELSVGAVKCKRETSTIAMLDHSSIRNALLEMVNSALNYNGGVLMLMWLLSWQKTLTFQTRGYCCWWQIIQDSEGLYM
jgi:hypothetical protein